MNRILVLLSSLGLLGLAVPVRGDWGPAWVETGMIWRDNVTNADRAPDQLPGWLARAEAGWETRRQVTRLTGLSAGGRLRSEAWSRFDGLNLLEAEAVFGLRHKFGVGPDRRSLSASVGGGPTGARESARSGWGGRARVAISQPVGPVGRLQAGLEADHYEARGRAFSHTGWSGVLAWDHRLAAGWALRATVGYREGDVVSYSTPPRPDLVKAGKILTLVETFERPVALLAYYFPASTVSVGLELDRAVGERTSLFLRAEQRETRHGVAGYRNRELEIGLRWAR